MPVQRLAAPAAPARPDPEPNVTPLIDVLLVLLVIFMLAQAVRAGLDAQLPPPAAEDGSALRFPPIVLQLTAEGGYAINRQPVPAAQLDQQIRAILAGREARVVFVDAAPARSYRDVVAAMDLARGAGAQLVGLMPADEPR